METITAHQGSTTRRTPRATRHRRSDSADCPPEAQGSAHPPCSCSAHNTTARRAGDRQTPGYWWYQQRACRTRHRSMRGTCRTCRTTRATASWCEAWSHDRRLRMIRAMRGSSRRNGLSSTLMVSPTCGGQRRPSPSTQAGQPLVGGTSQMARTAPFAAICGMPARGQRGTSHESSTVATNAAWISIHQIKHLRLRASHVPPGGAARYRTAPTSTRHRRAPW